MPKKGSDKIVFESFINKTLLTKIDSLIDRQDSLANIDKTNSRHTSFWAYFYQKDNQCNVAIVACFDNYKSEQVDGFINHKDKIITFYGKGTGCGNDFIQWDKIKTGKIKVLTDEPGFMEPFRREYLIVSEDSLKLVYEGY